MQADMTVSMDASPRVSSECRKRTISSENTSVEIQSKRAMEENICNTSSNDNQVSIPTKRSRIEISDEGEYDSSQEETQPRPSYSETLTFKKWLDIDITDTDAMIAPSVFSQAHKIKKSAQASLALPPAENMVNLWDFKEYEASGVSKDQEQMKNKSTNLGRITLQDMKTGGTTNLSRSFHPYHENSATSSSATSSTSNRGRGSFSSRPFRGKGGKRK